MEAGLRYVEGHQMGRSYTAGIALVASLLFGCSADTANPEEDGAKAVRAVGAPTLAAEATILKKFVAGPSAVVPEAQWPPAIKELRPQEVRVTPKGVFVQRRRVQGWKEGVFIGFPGVIVETPRGEVSPTFSRIEQQVYWYRLEG
jgi:hypothetical protein